MPIDGDDEDDEVGVQMEDKCECGRKLRSEIGRADDISRSVVTKVSNDDLR